MFQHYLAFSDKPVLKRYNMDITFISGGMIHEQLSTDRGADRVLFSSSTTGRKEPWNSAEIFAGHSCIRDVA